MEEKEHINRMENLLLSEEYTQLYKNPLNSCIKTVNETLKNMNVLTKKEKFKIKSDNPIIPRMYGLPKIHKPGVVVVNKGYGARHLQRSLAPIQNMEI